MTDGAHTSCVRDPGILPELGEQDARDPQAGCLRSAR